MRISNRASVIIIVVVAVVLILLVIWIIRAASNLTIKPKNYTVDQSIGEKIDAVVDNGNEGLNEVVSNEILTNSIKSNEVHNHSVSSNEIAHARVVH